jgi:hypothetical protein
MTNIEHVPCAGLSIEQAGRKHSERVDGYDAGNGFAQSGTGTNMQAQLNERTNVLVACDQNTERWLRMVLTSSNKLTYVSELHTVQGLVHSRRFDFIIASIYFSGFRMFDVLKAARQSELNATTPFLCIRSNASSLAAYADRSTKLALRCLGANYFLDVSDAELDSSASQRQKLRQQLEALINNRLSLVGPDRSILEPALQTSKSRLSE